MSDTIQEYNANRSAAQAVSAWLSDMSEQLDTNWRPTTVASGNPIATMLEENLRVDTAWYHQYGIDHYRKTWWNPDVGIIRCDVRYTRWFSGVDHNQLIELIQNSKTPLMAQINPDTPSDLGKHLHDAWGDHPQLAQLYILALCPLYGYKNLMLGETQDCKWYWIGHEASQHGVLVTLTKVDRSVVRWKRFVAAFKELFGAQVFSIEPQGTDPKRFDHFFKD